MTKNLTKAMKAAATKAARDARVVRPPAIRVHLEDDEAVVDSFAKPSRRAATSLDGTHAKPMTLLPAANAQAKKVHVWFHGAAYELKPQDLKAVASTPPTLAPFLGAALTGITGDAQGDAVRQLVSSQGRFGAADESGHVGGGRIDRHHLPAQRGFVFDH